MQTVQPETNQTPSPKPLPPCPENPPGLGKSLRFTTLFLSTTLCIPKSYIFIFVSKLVTVITKKMMDDSVSLKVVENFTFGGQIL